PLRDPRPVGRAHRGEALPRDHRSPLRSPASGAARDLPAHGGPDPPRRARGDPPRVPHVAEGGALRGAALAIALLLAGCQTDPWPAPIEGSTYRITDDRPAEGSELRIDLLANRAQCADAGIADLDACIPRVDRA